jgi:hypothetical protein
MCGSISMTIKPDSQTKVRTKEEQFKRYTIEPAGPIVEFYPKNVIDTQTNSNLFRNSSIKRVGRSIRNR